MARPIEPGEPFEIEYGKGHTLNLFGLSGRQERKLLREEKQFHKSEDPEALWDFLKSSLREFLPASEMPDDDFERFVDDNLNVSMMREIINKAQESLTVSEEDEKKSESPHSLPAESCANHAATNADRTEQPA